MNYLIEKIYKLFFKNGLIFNKKNTREKLLQYNIVHIHGL